MKIQIQVPVVQLSEQINKIINCLRKKKNKRYETFADLQSIYPINQYIT